MSAAMQITWNTRNVMEKSLKAGHPIDKPKIADYNDAIMKRHKIMHRII